MRIVCISDTHLQHGEHKIEVPDGDLLIHAGDLTISGTYLEVAEAGQWLKSLPHRHKIVIAGNHDFLFQTHNETARIALDAEGDLTYLQDQATVIQGVTIYGSPWTPRFYDWAFQLDRGENAKACWAKIPEATRILVTHGPPWGTLDRVRRWGRPTKLNPDGKHLEAKVGCEELTRRVAELPSLKLHVFGHIHPSHGVACSPQLTWVNAAICDDVYLPSHKPIVVDVDF